MIISEKDDIIQKKITEEMERGVTILKGCRFYNETGTQCPLLCRSKK